MGRKNLVNGKGSSLFHSSGDNMNRKKIFVVLAVFLVAGIAAAQDQVPINPAPGYYGSISVNGQPASPGTAITAQIGGAERGSMTTSASGFYGDDPGPSKLWVTGFQNEIGSTVTFYVNGVASQQTGILTGKGTLNRVDLTFTVPTGSVSPGDGGGSGSGGGGISSAEPFENIELSEIRDADLVAGVPVTFRFTSPELVVYELVITANVSAGMTSARVEQLKNISNLVTSSPPGNIHKNVNIWLGTSGFSVPKNIREGIVRFRVNKSWLIDENIDDGSISMMRWDGSQWVSLETKQVRTDDNYIYHEALTDRFSPFTITGVKAAPVSTPTTVPGIGASPTVTPLSVMPPMALNWILYVVAAIILIGAVYYYAMKNKQKKVK